MIESKTTRQFWNAFLELPSETRASAVAAFQLFRENPAHPSLRFKKLEGHEEIYSVRIGIGCRALGVMRGNNRIVWFRIGSHADYDHMI